MAHLARGAQDLQRRLPGLYDGQDGLIVRQTNPGGGQVIRNPNVAVYVWLRKTFYWTISLLLKASHTGTQTHTRLKGGISISILCA